MTSRTASLISKRSRRGGTFFTSARMRSTTSPARLPSLTIRPSACLASSRSGGRAPSQRKLACAFAIADVDDDCTTEGGRAVCRGNDKRCDVGPYDLAVLASVTLALQKPDSTAIDTLLHRGPIVLVSNLQRRKISQLGLRIAGHPLETRVRRHIPSALKIKGCDADRGDLEHGSPTLFARA